MAVGSVAESLKYIALPLLAEVLPLNVLLVILTEPSVLIAIAPPSSVVPPDVVTLWLFWKVLVLMLALLVEAVLMYSAPPASALLFVNVLLLIVSDPVLLIAPPSPNAVLFCTVTLVRVSVPRFSIAPPVLV